MPTRFGAMEWPRAGCTAPAKALVAIESSLHRVARLSVGDVVHAISGGMVPTRAPCCPNPCEMPAPPVDGRDAALPTAGWTALRQRCRAVRGCEGQDRLSAPPNAGDS